MQFFCLQLEASCSQLRFLAYSCVRELFCLQLELLYLESSSFAYSSSFFAYSSKVFLRSTSADCKQRSSTVNKKAPTGSRKASPHDSWSNVYRFMHVAPLDLTRGSLLTFTSGSVPSGHEIQKKSKRVPLLICREILENAPKTKNIP